MKIFFKVMFFLFALILFLALPQSGFTEAKYTTGEEEKKAVKLEEMVITATRTETDVDSAPASVT